VSGNTTKQRQQLSFILLCVRYGEKMVFQVVPKYKKKSVICYDSGVVMLVYVGRLSYNTEGKTGRFVRKY